jgi:hypothetical protein
VRRRSMILILVACCATSCSRSPYGMFYQCTADGLKPTLPPRQHLVQRCTPEALETRTQELLAANYVVIGRAEFTNTVPYHKELARKEESQGAEIILYCDTPESEHMEFAAGEFGAAYRKVVDYRHRAIYFARPAEPQGR